MELQSVKKEPDRNKVKIDALFDEYRRSGLGLMTTIIGLSSGGFIGLFQNDRTKDFSFLYFVPIAIALMQQLTHYLGSHKKAIAGHHWFITSNQTNADEGMDAYVDAKINAKISKFLYGLSDKFCWISCLSLGLVTIYPLIVLSSVTVRIIILSTIVSCLTYWLVKWLTVKQEIARTDWFEE